MTTPKRIIGLVSRELISGKETKYGPLESEARFRIFFERGADAMSLLDPQTLRFRFKSMRWVVEAASAFKPANYSFNRLPDIIIGNVHAPGGQDRLINEFIH